MQPICEVTGDVRILSNGLSNAAFPNLERIGGQLVVAANSTLTSLGLESLTSVGGDLYVYNNDSLTSLAELESITSVGGYLAVEGNASLTSLAGLESLTSVGGIIVVDNFALSQCQADALALRLGTVCNCEDNGGTTPCN